MGARITGAALIFLVSWGLTTHGNYSTTSDEPHYLMVAHWIPSFRVEPDTAWLAAAALLFGVVALNVALVWAVPHGEMADSAKGWRT